MAVKKTGRFVSFMALLICLYFKIRYFIYAYCVGAYYLVVELYGKYTGKTKRLKRNDLPFKRDQIAIVTGGSRGIGLKVVEKLLILGMHVIIGVPLSEEECKNLKNRYESRSLNCKIQVWPLDLRSMHSVKIFADMVLNCKKKLRVLINNAGVMYVPYRLTPDGYEEHFQVNYLGHCLLTKLLLPVLKQSGTPELYARIVNVSSSTHFVGNINLTDLQSKNFYSPYHCYLQSKLAIVLHTYFLQEILEDSKAYVSVNCLHPGIVYTNLYQHVWWAKYIGKYLFKTVDEGAETIIYAAVSPAMEGIGGKYLEECQVIQSSKLSRNIKLQKQLADITNNFLEQWL